MIFFLLKSTWPIDFIHYWNKVAILIPAISMVVNTSEEISNIYDDNK